MRDEELVKDAEEWLANTIPVGKKLFVNAVCSAYLEQRDEILRLREENERLCKLLRECYQNGRKDLPLDLLDDIRFQLRGKV